MFGSYFFSILLHLALALLIFLWPSSPPVRLDQPMMQISVNMGAPGGNRMASPVLGPQGKPMPTKAAPQPAPAEQAASAVPVAREDTVQPKAEPKKESQPKPKPKPEPKPDEVALAQKKQPKKPKDEEEEEPKEKPKEKPKDDGKKDKKEASENAKKTDDKAKPAKESDKKKDGVDLICQAGRRIFTAAVSWRRWRRRRRRPRWRRHLRRVYGAGHPCRAAELEYADLLPREPFRAGQRKA